MNELTSEQLEALTERINHRFAEFDYGNMRLLDPMTPGAVRIAHDVIRAFLERPNVTVLQPLVPAIHPAVQPRKPLPDPDVARDKLADALAQGAAGSLLALELRKPRTLEEVDAEDDPDAKKRADFAALVAELQRVAMGGVMPRMTTWDVVKPASMPTSKWIINNYRMGWRQLAEMADLQMDRKGGAEMEPVHRNGAA